MTATTAGVGAGARRRPGRREVVTGRAIGEPGPPVRIYTPEGIAGPGFAPHIPDTARSRFLRAVKDFLKRLTYVA